ncbi:MAG TPA: hypothetical protein VMA77_17925 [Solirubrobacteraceae bacterium]|nr:hypothetical protein [Solirubrobacteraceae bacterium]HUA47118.1 hypothetical protein [Solirubrobacteraceae bacterium]
MRAAPAHLEAKLRFWDLSVGQIATAFAGIMLGVAWAKFISPLHGMLAATSGAYIAALPIVPVFVASQTELDLGGLLVGALRWRRRDGRYLPGGGETAQGYLLWDEHTDIGPGDAAEALELELQALWDQHPASTSAQHRDPSRLVAPSDRESTNDRDPGRGSRAWSRNGTEKR